MGRFSKLEPTRPASAPETQPPPEARPPAPGAPGGGEAEESAQRTAGEWLALADQAFLRGEFKQALRWCSRALDKETTLLEGWVTMVRILLFRGDLGQAETWCARALGLFPESGPLLAIRAVIFARRGMLQQALNNSDAVLARHAAEPTAQIARGEVLLLAGSKNAEFCFGQALKLAPANDWRTPAAIGMIHEERRMWARAVHYYAQAAERDAASAALWWRIAACRAELGQSQSSRTALQRARELCEEGDPLLLKIERAGAGSLWKRLRGLFRRK